MSVHDAIYKVISTRGVCSQKLRRFFCFTGIKPLADKARVDNDCSFGKWLHERMESSKEKESSYYLEIVQLHAEFNAASGEILNLALLGEKDKACKLMGLSDEFAQKSCYLKKKMKAWQASF